MSYWWPGTAWLMGIYEILGTWELCKSVIFDHKVDVNDGKQVSESSRRCSILWSMCIGRLNELLVTGNGLVDGDICCFVSVNELWRSDHYIQYFLTFRTCLGRLGENLTSLLARSLHLCIKLQNTWSCTNIIILIYHLPTFTSIIVSRHYTKQHSSLNTYF